MSNDGSSVQNRVADSQVHNLVQAQVVHLYQNTSDGLSLKPQQVPEPTRTFTNQKSVLAEMDLALLRAPGTEDAVFVVLTGPPGVGKRATARYWLRHHRNHFPGGTFYADLGAGPQLGLVSETLRDFLLAVGENPAGIPGTLGGRAARFRTMSEGRRIAIVVENAWSAAHARWFRPGPGPSCVLVTPTQQLTGLGVEETATYVEVSLLDDDAARALLVAVIGRERVDAEPDATRSLLRTCGGLAIAVSVLASTLDSHPFMRLSRLVADLEKDSRRPKVLSPSMDRSVYGVFSNAYDRVSTSAQYCYRILGWHPGTGAVGLAALAAGLGFSEDETRDVVNELVSVALVAQVGEDRYLMHDLMRVHARDLELTAAPVGPDAQAAVERMLDFYHERVVIAGHAMMPGRGWNEKFFGGFAFDQRPARQVLGEDPAVWLETERDNLRACVETAYRRGQFERVCHLAVMLWPLHEQGKHLEDQIDVNEKGLEAAQELGRVDLEALIGVQRGFPDLHLGRPEKAADFFSAALVAARMSGRADLEATALESLGLAHLAQEQPDEALGLLRQNLALALELEDARRIALARLHLARAEAPALAVGLLDQAREGFLGLIPQDTYNAAKAQMWLGRKLIDLDRFGEAAETLPAAMTVMTQLRMPFGCLQIVESLGDLAAALDDVEESRRQYRAALAIAESGQFVPETVRLQGKLGDPAESLEDGLERGQGEPGPD